MTITVTCGQCDKTFKTPDTAAGRKARCPSCGLVIAIPKPAADAVAPPADDTMAALAGTGGEARKPVVPEAVTPQPVAAEPLEPQQAAPPEEAEDEQDELVAVPPIGVQTPTGLSAGGRALARRALRWHRRLAGSARTAGFALGGVCLVLGISGMIVLALRGQEMLMPALGVFLAMAVLAATLALGGLLARHVLLMLADLGNVVHRQQKLLDEINERLD
ncbi:MAG: hypothetical protein GWP05_07765 [Anaerolineaceae bacterium]|nr:hypothetical protein [Anaerolineaceae bacterium]